MFYKWLSLLVCGLLVMIIALLVVSRESVTREPVESRDRDGQKGSTNDGPVVKEMADQEKTNASSSSSANRPLPLKQMEPMPVPTVDVADLNKVDHEGIPKDANAAAKQHHSWICEAAERSSRSCKAAPSTDPVDMHLVEDPSDPAEQLFQNTEYPIIWRPDLNLTNDTIYEYACAHCGKVSQGMKAQYVSHSGPRTSPPGPLMLKCPHCQVEVKDTVDVLRPLNAGAYESTCPWCSAHIMITENDFNCQIFRHGTWKDGRSEPIPPHASREEVELWLSQDKIWGCGYPLQSVNRSIIKKCDWI